MHKTNHTSTRGKMNQLIWRLDDLNYPDPEGRPEELSFVESYDLFRNSLQPGAWQIVEIWDEEIVLYAANNREFHAVPFDFIEKLYNEPPASDARLGGGLWLIFDGLVAGPDLKIAFDNAREAFRNRRTYV